MNPKEGLPCWPCCQDFRYQWGKDGEGWGWDVGYRDGYRFDLWLGI